MDATLHLFDDALVREWRPFGLTRPASELLLGRWTVRERAELFWGGRCAGTLADARLLGFEEDGSPPLLDSRAAAAGPTGFPRVFFSSRAIPVVGRRPAGERRDLGVPATILMDGEAVGWILPAGAPNPAEEHLLDPSGAPHRESIVEIDGFSLRRPWEIVARNAAALRADLSHAPSPSSEPFFEGAVALGPERLTAGAGVEVEPGVVLDLRRGPIHLDAGARIEAHTRLEGPAFVGRDSVLLGGRLSRVSIGPACKVRGEVEDSVILGFSNKAHDGYLGHSYLGRWVNLGAFTTTSDLKNNYSSIRTLGSQGEEEDTGLLKLGSLLGDHVKTGIGTLLHAGSVVGAGSHLFGSSTPPKYVPPFRWGGRTNAPDYRLDDFLDSAARVLARRDRRLAEGMRALLARAWKASRDARREGRAAG